MSAVFHVSRHARANELVADTSLAVDAATTSTSFSLSNVTARTTVSTTTALALSDVGGIVTVDNSGTPPPEAIEIQLPSDLPLTGTVTVRPLQDSSTVTIYVRFPTATNVYYNSNSVDGTFSGYTPAIQSVLLYNNLTATDTLRVTMLESTLAFVQMSTKNANTTAFIGA